MRSWHAQDYGVNHQEDKQIAMVWRQTILRGPDEWHYLGKLWDLQKLGPRGKEQVVGRQTVFKGYFWPMLYVLHCDIGAQHALHCIDRSPAIDCIVHCSDIGTLLCTALP